MGSRASAFGACNQSRIEGRSKPGTGRPNRTFGVVVVPALLHGNQINPHDQVTKQKKPLFAFTPSFAHKRKAISNHHPNPTTMFRFEKCLSIALLLLLLTILPTSSSGRASSAAHHDADARLVEERDSAASPSSIVASSEWGHDHQKQQQQQQQERILPTRSCRLECLRRKNSALSGCKATRKCGKKKGAKVRGACIRSCNRVASRASRKCLNGNCKEPKVGGEGVIRGCPKILWPVVCGDLNEWFANQCVATDRKGYQAEDCKDGPDRPPAVPEPEP